MYPKCLKCGRTTIKQEICSKCRPRANTYMGMSREETNIKADTLLSMAKEDAKNEYKYWNDRWVSGDTSEEVRYQRAQMYALMNREEITESTLT